MSLIFDWSERHIESLGSTDLDMWESCLFFFTLWYFWLAGKIRLIRLNRSDKWEAAAVSRLDKLCFVQQEFNVLGRQVLQHDQRNRWGSRGAQQLILLWAPSCNPLTSFSDASSFAPFVDKRKPLYFFSSDICRWWKVSFPVWSRVWSCLAVLWWHIKCRWWRFNILILRSWPLDFLLSSH